MTSLPAQAIEARLVEALSEFARGSTSYGICIVEDALALLRAGQASIRADALEEAAQVADSLDDHGYRDNYCGGVPTGHRVLVPATAKEAAAAIRALKENASG